MPADPSRQDFLVRPFAALRPTAEYAAEVAAPPYDVMNADEARALASGKTRSFLHVSRAEIDLPAGTDPYADKVYAAAAAYLARLEDTGVLQRESQATYYVYQISRGAHQQTGIAVAASVAAYRDNRIQKHELTRPAKETDRVRQIDAVNAMTGPVMLVYRANPTVAELLAAQTETEALLQAEVDGWQHRIWPIVDNNTVDALSTLFNNMPNLYIADGHHRSAAALRISQQRGIAAADAFLAVSFPDDAVTILDYNRVVRDLNGLSVNDLLDAVAQHFVVTAAAQAVKPAAPWHYGLYLPGQWYSLAPRETPDRDDPVARLDVSVLDRTLLEPVLGIKDPRTDSRIDFIGGSRGPSAIAERVDSGDMAVGFTLYPTAMADLIAVAEAGLIMPPKSTWFEPKLADGLLSLPLA